MVILERERNLLEQAVGRLVRAQEFLTDALGGPLSGQELTDTTQALTQTQNALRNARKASARVLVTQRQEDEATATAARVQAQADLAAIP